MNYIAIEQYKRAWIFRHKDLPIPADDLALIKPLSEARSLQIWHQHISENSRHPEHFSTGDWAASDNCWQADLEPWESAWDSTSTELPSLLLEHCDWDDNITVFFCYEDVNVIETSWAIFKRYWKNFLFLDNGPLLIGRKRNQVIQFLETGNARLGMRP